jgi:hypothetical protein
MQNRVVPKSKDQRKPPGRFHRPAFFSFKQAGRFSPTNQASSPAGKQTLKPSGQPEKQSRFAVERDPNKNPKQFYRAYAQPVRASRA